MSRPIFRRLSPAFRARRRRILRARLAEQRKRRRAMRAAASAMTQADDDGRPPRRRSRWPTAAEVLCFGTFVALLLHLVGCAVSVAVVEAPDPRPAAVIEVDAGTPHIEEIER